MQLRPQTPVRLRVAKLGGSLFDLPDLPQRLDCWLKAQPTAATLMIVGGGGMVDAVRDLAEADHYSESFLHWLCVDLLDISFRLMAERLPTWNRIVTAEQLAPWHQPINCDRPQPSTQTSQLDMSPNQAILVRVASFYSAATQPSAPDCLPCSWETTSDALAAWLARLCRADELVLFKSRDADPAATVQQWAEAGIVDQAFPAVIRGVCPVRLINLR